MTPEADPLEDSDAVGGRGNALRGTWRLVRPVNVVIMAAATIIGALLVVDATGLPPSALTALLLAALAATSVGAGANAINDVFDLEIDRINRPDRPVPSGEISLTWARGTWAVLSGIGLLLAALVSGLHLVIAVSSVALLFGYSKYLKRQPVTGNVAVAVVIGLALPFGGLAVLDPMLPVPGVLMVGALFAFLTTLAREIVKDIEDVEGDAQTAARTLPIVTGTTAAARVAAVLVLVTVAALPLGLGAGLPPMFLALTIPAAALLLVTAWVIFGIGEGASGDGDRLRARTASAVLKTSMVAGLAALALI